MNSHLTKLTSLWPPFVTASSPSPPTTSSDLLESIKLWFQASSISQDFAGQLWTNESGRDAVYPLIIFDQIIAHEPGEALGDHSNQIQISILGQPAETIRALSDAFHLAFMPNVGRTPFTYTFNGQVYTEFTTLYEGGSFTKRPRGPTAATGLGGDGQLWRASRMYTVMASDAEEFGL